MTGYLKQTLHQIFQNCPFPYEGAPDDTPITGVVYDSRQVQPGNIFVALAGGSTDGHHYIPQAIQRGAAAVVGSQAETACSVPYVRVADTRLALAYISAAFYRFPARQMTIIGVTGTDGKTTTANLIYNILLKAGLRAGIISTVNATIGSEILDTGLHVTTPEAPDVQLYLSRMLAAGLTHVVLETTSHGLAQARVAFCEFDVAVVTNITHEHLDYHGSYEAYRAAKAILFEELQRTHLKHSGNYRTAILNMDDVKSYEHLRHIPCGLQVCYGLQDQAGLRATQVVYTPSGVSFTVQGPGVSFPIQSPLVGSFNVSNILAAVSATVMGLGLPISAAQEGVASVAGVPGRMECIDYGQPFTAIVDFAHTPNALRRALEAARQMTSGRVLAVFGSAGLRDRLKRRMMAEVSAEMADLTFLTAEDPRTESLDQILEEMAQGAVAKGGVEGQTFWRVPDRGQAIREALKQARPGDMVIACGKGHEQSMCFGVEEFPWDDRTAMRAALAEILGIEGPAMPYLPTQG
ncbi:MAG TPA: UDP-N-acetylmuramoyl-L-alanyl-D-glutamate--2,6-diaminopimelate ligase [Anaerolineaceae bacterium]|nr:UDP-N-acetylmuramoyl-L-alanyl-D-glutamate--2,6-diaminopimelate ligase [Anaerolineaceae bacterium]HPN51551.1 UDP-N-acetylmuramoyl-L-alanyl-D-glutamate--2,6-diaminopimelate ligase [Anaerolineaceae bacterium]